MNKLSKYTFILILVITLGTFVRVFKITTLPFPPNGDELAFGYYGWSLLHFQMDEFGTKFPMNFPSIGDYKYPGLAYLNILPAAIFGLSEITTRFWSIISGIVLIPLVYLLVTLLFQSRLMALSTAFIVALSPWDITVSRLGYENHPALTLVTAALVALLAITKIKSKEKILFITSLILFIIASFCYAAERIFIPLILLSIIVISFKNSQFSIIRKPTITLFIILFIVISVSLIPWQNRGRAEAVAWKSLNGTQQNRLQELLVEAGTSPVRIPSIITRSFHNKFRISLEDFLYRYSNHFSPKFLFFEGEAAIERIPDMGVLPLIFIFFLPFGFLTILNYTNKQSSLFVLAWMIISPLPSALTLGEPHINRGSLMIVPLSIISAYGFYQFINLFSGRLKTASLFIITSLFFFNSFYSLNQIFVQKPVNKPWYTEQVNKEMVSEVFKLKDRYAAVAIPKNEYMFFLFYQKISPPDFIKRASIREATRENSWDRVERLDNIYFNMAYDCPKGGKINVLYICKGANIPQNSKLLKVIRYWDNVPAYTFLEFYPLSQMPKELPELPQGLQYMVDIEKSPESKDGLIPTDSTRLW